jgi:DNA-binding IclR family transcriptional regulator
MYRRAFLSAETIAPALLRLREATGETASFYVRDGDKRVCLYRVNSERPLRHHLDEGARLPLDRGAAGRLLLAYEGGVGARERAGAGGGADGEEIRAQGHAISLGERDPEIAAVAVPVFAAGGDILGALTISGLVTRFDAAMVTRCLAALKAEARRLNS